MRLLTPRPPRVPRAALRRRWTLWLCAMGLGLLTALIGFPGVESSFRQLKNAIHAHPASGRVAVVEIDDRSLAELGRWPIPRAVYARLVDTLFAHGARSVTFDLDFSSASNATDDGRLADALARYPGRVTMADRLLVDPKTGAASFVRPMPTFRRLVRVANMSFPFDSAGSVSLLPYAFQVGDIYDLGIALALSNGTAPAAASVSDHGILTPLIEQLLPSRSLFPIDGSIKLSTIPHATLVDVIRSPRSANLFAGRDVVIGTMSEQVGDMYSVPPYGRISGVWVQAIGAETLLHSAAVYLGPLPAIAVVGVLSIVLLGFRRRRLALIALIVAVIALPVTASLLPTGLTIAVLPGLVILLTACGCEAAELLRETLRNRATVNQVSGLLNLTALRALPVRIDTRLIVAHIHNFAEATATLPVMGEAALIAQIASRLRLGMTESELYHGDNGVFAWFSHDDIQTVGERLDALHALFRSAVTVEEQTLDLVVTFGIDDDDGRSIANRLGSALVAAAEARAEGGRWREFDKAKLADTAWKLSMLSELDAAIDDGALWVAYQPKLDLRDRRIVGAEALVRWTHPEKGAISPIEFIAAAEQHNRIEKLTAHVLERAVLAAATINAHEIGFGIAVNLSARLLDGPGLVEQVAAVLARHGLDPDRLTLEVTETASLASERSLDALHALRALGVHISIDDYGTGLSTLEYLRKIPAGEIKIDRSFVQAVLTSSSDLLMVNSTIQLAHSLGHIVVAEGVESADVLVRLGELGCDVAQGYHVGRPMTFQDLARRLLAERRYAA